MAHTDVTAESQRSPRVALTFDDGPLPPYTSDILDLLARHAAKATFFVCGNAATAHPDVVRRIVNEGHALGNHTFSHPDLRKVSRDRMREEIERTQAAITQITGRSPTLFRAPYGSCPQSLPSLLAELQLRLVGWSYSPEEWLHDSSRTADGLLDHASDGAVILLHDGMQRSGDWIYRLWPALVHSVRRRLHGGGDWWETPFQSRVVEAVQTALLEGERRGLRFVTVDDLP